MATDTIGTVKVYILTVFKENTGIICWIVCEPVAVFVSLAEVKASVGVTRSYLIS